MDESEETPKEQTTTSEELELAKDNGSLYGLLRLRFNDDPKAPAQAFPELSGCALIRELHVYGKVKAVRQNASNAPTEGQDVQHVGIGRQLMAEAERLALERGYDRIAVISGVGVRNYYRKLGYVLQGSPGNFLIKDLGKDCAGLCFKKEEIELHATSTELPVLEKVALNTTPPAPENQKSKCPVTEYGPWVVGALALAGLLAYSYGKMLKTRK